MLSQPEPDRTAYCLLAPVTTPVVGECRCDEPVAEEPAEGYIVGLAERGRGGRDSKCSARGGQRGPFRIKGMCQRTMSACWCSGTACWAQILTMSMQ